MTSETIIEAIIETLEVIGYSSKEWTASDHTRVYVSRTLSKGRRQDMGFIRVDDNGEVVYSLNRAKALVRDACDDAIAKAI